MKETEGSNQVLEALKKYKILRRNSFWSTEMSVVLYDFTEMERLQNIAGT